MKVPPALDGGADDDDGPAAPKKASCPTCRSPLEKTDVCMLAAFTAIDEEEEDEDMEKV